MLARLFPETGATLMAPLTCLMSLPVGLAELQENCGPSRERRSRYIYLPTTCPIFPCH